MAKTLTGNSRKREERLQNLMLSRQIARFERRIMGEIRRTMRAAASVDADLNQIEQMHRERMGRLLLSLHESSARQFAEYIALSFAAPKKLPVMATPIMDAVLVDFASKYGSELITNIIVRKTITDIKQIIEAGINDGLSEIETARLIRAVAPTKSASRAQTIARTETHAAANWGSLEAVKATGINFKREWLAGADKRTRTTHIEADGQIRGLYEPFQIGAASLMYPGEYTGNHPEETINCRCVIAYIPAD